MYAACTMYLVKIRNTFIQPMVLLLYVPIKKCVFDLLSPKDTLSERSSRNSLMVASLLLRSILQGNGARFSTTNASGGILAVRQCGIHIPFKTLGHAAPFDVKSTTLCRPWHGPQHDASSPRLLPRLASSADAVVVASKPSAAPSATAHVWHDE